MIEIRKMFKIKKRKIEDTKIMAKLGLQHPWTVYTLHSDQPFVNALLCYFIEVYSIIFGMGRGLDGGVVGHGSVEIEKQRLKTKLYFLS